MELSKSESLYRAIVENLTELICRSLPDGTLTFVNEAYCRYFNKAADELIGTNFLEFLPEDEMATVVKGFESINRDNPVAEWEHRVITPEGKVRWHHWTSHAIFDDCGEIVEFQGVGIDITEQKNVEKAARESHERYQRLFNEMVSGAALHEIICDSEGKPVDYRFLEVNPAFEKLTGLKGKDIIGKTVLEVLPDTEAVWIEKYGDVALSGKSIFFDNYSGVHDKHYEIMAYSPEQGEFAVMFHDVTSRKAAELERERLMKTLEAKNNELQGIVYTASHDLKSPLVNIKGFSGILTLVCEQIMEQFEKDIPGEELKSSIAGLIKDDIPEALGFINSGTDEMNSLLNGLLEVSRVGNSRIHIRKLEMKDHVKNLIDAMQFQIDEAQASVEIGKLPDCMGDGSQVSRVLTNLVDNALKYRSPDRKCSIHIRGEVENGMCVYRVKDNGVGIHIDHQDRVFELFHRLEPSGEITGDGLGLTIATRILDRLDGLIWVESKPGEGSSFFISLPVSK